MKKTNLFFFFALFCLSATIFSCQEDSTNKELLVDKKWVLVAETTDGSDSYKNYKACQIDNIESFTAAGKYTIDEGASKCASNDPQVETVGDWTMTPDELQIDVKATAFGLPITLNFQIVEISKSNLKLKYRFGNSEIISTYNVKK